MALCKDQMAALIVTKKSKSWRDKPTPVRNVLGETLSAHFANAIGKSNAKRGWRSKPFIFFGKRRVGTHTVGRLTRSDLEAGWNGGMSTAEAKETTRHRPHAFFQRSDAPRGSWCGLESTYILLQWGAIWAKRKLKGWSMQAICSWFLKEPNERKFPGDLWSVGVPNWYTEHQP